MNEITITFYADGFVTPAAEVNKASTQASDLEEDTDQTT